MHSQSSRQEVMQVIFRIREIRMSKGMTQTDLAKKAEITRATLWRLETGEDYDPSVNTLKRIADALNVTLSDLILH